MLQPTIDCEAIPFWKWFCPLRIKLKFHLQYVQEVTKKFNQSLTMQCTLELVTCPSCIISLKFNYINFPSNCENPKNGAGYCRCDYIILSEPPFDDQKNLIYNCGTMISYESLTRSLQIKFVYWNNYTDAFHMEYKAKRKSFFIELSFSISFLIA